METIADAEKHPRIWYRYFVAPSIYAKKATAISCNIFNLGLASLIIGLFVGGAHVAHYNYAFRDLTDNYLDTLSRRSGEYRFITGGKSSSPRACIVDTASGKELACSGELFRYPPENSKAHVGVAWIDPDYGVVRITVDALEVVSPQEIQTRLRNGIRNFGGCIFVFFVCLMIAFYRQISLVSAHQKRLD